MATGDKIYIGIKSIQRGTITIPADSLTATVTINAVDMSKAIVNVTGASNTFASSGGYAAYWSTHIQLTASNTITATRGAVGSCTNTIAFEVIEFY